MAASNNLNVYNYYLEELNLEEKLLLIKKYRQINLYTVYKSWCLQLFHLEFTANDGLDCIWKLSSEDLNKLLDESLEYVNESEYCTIYDI